MLLLFARREVLETALRGDACAERTDFRAVGLTGPKIDRGRSFFTQQIARSVRGEIPDVTTSSVAPTAARGSAKIRACVFPASPIVAEVFGSSPEALRATERGQSCSPARLTAVAATWVRWLDLVGQRQPQPSRAWRSECGSWQLRPCWCSRWADAGSPPSTSRQRSRTRPRSEPPGRRSGRSASTLRGSGSCGPGATGLTPRSSFATRAPSPASPPSPGPRRPPWRPCAASLPPVAARTAARAGRRPRR